MAVTVGQCFTTMTLVIWGFRKGKHLSASLSVTTTVPRTAPSPPTAVWSEVRVSAYRGKRSLGPTQGAEAALTPSRGMAR